MRPEDGLNYELTFEERPGYLFAHFRTAEISEEIAMDYLSRIADKCGELSLSRVLLQRDAPNVLSPSEQFHVIQHFLNIAHDIRVAGVNEVSSIHEDLGFAETTAVNRGAQYRLFSNTEDALTWLLA